MDEKTLKSTTIALCALGCIATLGCGDDGADACGSLGVNCSTDSDCGTLGVCLGSYGNGICGVKADRPCSDEGSQAECPSGSQCWTSNGGSSYCYPSCSSCGCGDNGRCDTDGSCVPGTGSSGGGGGGGGGNTQCSCSCRCSGCTASVTATCSGGSGCSSCSSVCRDTCSSDPYCGSYLYSSGSCY